MSQTHPQRAVLNDCLLTTQVHIRTQHSDPVSHGVFFQCFKIVKTHRLVVEQPNEKLQGPVVLQPRHLVRRHPERKGVSFRKLVHTVELAEDAFGGVGRNAVCECARDELILPVGDLSLVVSACERPSHLVALDRTHASDMHCQLAKLVLVKRHTICAFQCRFFQRVIELPIGILAHVTPDEHGHAVVHPDARPDCPDLPCHLGQVARAQAGNRLHLRRRFDLKNPDRVGVMDVGIDGVVLEIDPRNIDSLFGPFTD